MLQQRPTDRTMPDQRDRAAERPCRTPPAALDASVLIGPSRAARLVGTDRSERRSPRVGPVTGATPTTRSTTASATPSLVERPQDGKVGPMATWSPPDIQVTAVHRTDELTLVDVRLCAGLNPPLAPATLILDD